MTLYFVFKISTTNFYITSIKKKAKNIMTKVMSTEKTFLKLRFYL